ncbi:ATP-binding protein [Streptomyces sp. NPDC052676]|uniref:ATP-binding protein n=1 Tax=Streptomyces sp. NPDC052676 TaxID=3154953 RepID=UPI003415D9B1
MDRSADRETPPGLSVRDGAAVLAAHVCPAGAAPGPARVDGSARRGLPLLRRRPAPARPGQPQDRRRQARPLRTLSAAQADDLYELVSERQRRSLIITSNRAPSDWYPLFPNPVVAESLLDRLISTSHQVITNGPSYRPNKRPGTPPTRSNKKNRWTSSGYLAVEAVAGSPSSGRGVSAISSDGCA